MPSSDNRPHQQQRSRSTRPSRQMDTNQEQRGTRSTSVPARPVIIILTNMPNLLRHARGLQQPVKRN